MKCMRIVSIYVCLVSLEYSEQFLLVKKRLEVFYTVWDKMHLNEHKQAWDMLCALIGAAWKIHRLLYLMFRWLLEPLQLNNHTDEREKKYNKCTWNYPTNRVVVGYFCEWLKMSIDTRSPSQYRRRGVHDVRKRLLALRSRLCAPGRNCYSGWLIEYV